MSTTEPFYITVPASGTITLPPEFSGKTVRVDAESDDLAKIQRLREEDRKFRQHKSVDEIIQERGLKTVQSLEELMTEEPAWDSEEEFFAFLEAIGEDINLYR